MGQRLYVNNYSTRLTAQLLSGATTANVTAGSGAALAGANGTNWYIGTLRKMSGFKEVSREIVKITNEVVDALTIVRAQESTSALQFEIGDQLDIDITAASMTDPQVNQSAGTAVFAADASGGAGIQIANNGTATPMGAASFSGMIMIVETQSFGDAAIFICATALGTPIAAQTTGARYSSAATTAGKINVYYNGANHIEIENKTGSTITVSVMALRGRTA